MCSSLNASLTEAILAILRCQPDMRLCIVFGSLAAGKGSAESDLDIAVSAGHPLAVSEKMALMEELAESIGRPIDLVDLQAVGEPLLGQILQHGKRILGSDTDYARLITRHLFDQADFLPCRDRVLAERRQLWIGK